MLKQDADGRTKDFCMGFVFSIYDYTKLRVAVIRAIDYMEQKIYDEARRNFMRKHGLSAEQVREIVHADDDVIEQDENYEQDYQDEKQESCARLSEPS
jgi:uncharacterized DUF497 family protein